MKLALCIVGCGQFARTFVQGLQPVRDDLDLFFASRDRARARAYAARFQGCGAFGSYAAAAADPICIKASYLPHHHGFRPREHPPYNTHSLQVIGDSFGVFFFVYTTLSGELA